MSEAGLTPLLPESRPLSRDEASLSPILGPYRLLAYQKTLLLRARGFPAARVEAGRPIWDDRNDASLTLRCIQLLDELLVDDLIRHETRVFIACPR
jgi:hypothetical protein